MKESSLHPLLLAYLPYCISHSPRCTLPPFQLPHAQTENQSSNGKLSTHSERSHRIPRTRRCRYSFLPIPFSPKSHPLTLPGNIKQSPSLNPVPDDLATPTLKSNLYTTGRGGTGNMAANDHTDPSLARAAQDVDAPASLFKEPENHVHVGRGGAANVAKLSEEDARMNKERNQEERGMLGRAKDAMGEALARVKSNDDRKRSVS